MKHISNFLEYAQYLVIGYVIGLAFNICLMFAASGMFPYRLAQGEILFYADYPIPDYYAILAQRMSETVSRSPLYRSGMPFRVHLCKGKCRYLFFTLLNKQAIGYYDRANENIFIDVRSMFQSRELLKTMVHEATHAIVHNNLGFIEALFLQQWVSEGYAEYIAHATPLSKHDLKEVEVSHIRETAPTSYRRYHLLVANALDVKRIPLETLLHSPPTKRDLEKELGAI